MQAGKLQCCVLSVWKGTIWSGNEIFMKGNIWLFRER